MECQFVVGQKVVCLRDKWEHLKDERLSFPVLNGIYTIREIKEGSNKIHEPKIIGLLLHEIKNPVISTIDGTQEIGFHYVDFAPLQEQKRKTDISALEKILDPANWTELLEEV